VTAPPSLVIDDGQNSDTV